MTLHWVGINNAAGHRKGEGQAQSIATVRGGEVAFLHVFLALKLYLSIDAWHQLRAGQILPDDLVVFEYAACLEPVSHRGPHLGPLIEAAGVATRTAEPDNMPRTSEGFTNRHHASAEATINEHSVGVIIILELGYHLSHGHVIVVALVLGQQLGVQALTQVDHKLVFAGPGWVNAYDHRGKAVLLLTKVSPY